MSDRLDEPPSIANFATAFPRGEVVDIGAQRKKKKQTHPAGTFDWPETAGNAPRAKSVANFNAWNARRALRFRANVFTITIEVQTKTHPWAPLDDATEVQEWLALTEAGCDMGREFWSACAHAEAHRNPHDPPLLYVNSLAWDGVDRLDTWLIRRGGAPDTAFVRAVSRIVLVAAVRRIRSPGIKFDAIPVLEGRQGIGKSRLVRAISPDPAWFTDALEIGADSKLVIEQTAGKLIVELAELAGLSTRDVERVKAFASRQEDRARLSYGRYTTERKRRFVCFATVNPDASGTYAIDVTGNRRLWPIPLSKQIDVDALIAEREQLWAEAAHLEAEDEPIHLSSEVEAEAHQEQAARVVEDPWTDTLSATVSNRQFVLVQDVWGAVAADVSKRNGTVGRRIENVMARLGWEKTVRRNPATRATEKVFRRVDAGDDDA